MHGEPAPPVALVTRHSRADGDLELAGELLRELPGGVQAFAGAGVERVDVDPLEQLRAGGDRHDAGPQVAFDPAAELGDEPDHVERQHGRQLPAVRRLQCRHDEHADGPVDVADGFELLAGEREPAP